MFNSMTIKQCVTGAATAILLTGAFGGPAMAASGDTPWKIQEVSGEASFVDQDKGAQAAAAGTIMDAGDRIATGADGRVVITRGAEQITVSASSEMGLPIENDGPYSTRILQNLGTILLKVQKQPNQHFEVQTPYMAAVVKGTTFTVSVGDRGAAVHVVEGAVQVADLAGQQVQLIRPGQTATRSSDSAAPVKVTGVGAAPAAKGDKATVDSPTGKSDDAKAAPGSRGNGAAAAKGGPNGGGNKGKGGPKISKALGNLNLNIAAATNGLASGPGKSANAGQGKGKAKSAGRSGGNGIANRAAAVPLNNLVAQATGNNGNGNGNANGSSNGNGGGGNANGNGNGGGNGGGNGNGNGNGNGSGN